MAKSKRGSRHRGVEHRSTDGAPATVHCAPSTTAARVFAIEELARLILQNLPADMLLTKVQRVCRRWRAVARELLQPLFDGDAARPNSRDCRRKINPLLFEHFGQIMNDGLIALNIELCLTGQRFWRMRSMTDLPIATCGPGRAVHNAYARAGASWRNMQIYQPPVYEIRYRGEPGGDVEVATVADGVRLGQVYDILTAIVSDTKGPARNEMWITWPQASAGDADAARGEAVVRDYIVMQRKQHPLQKHCECWHKAVRRQRCFCELSKEKLRLHKITSNKWRVISQDFKQENLLVTI
ncbi:hypothetical protein IF1G_01002 [Cordyceps javanica]|uniref:F-box domain-containing protein n=1 Tax=Cordyceps javanica TaxID=43265 RepID=A0A545VH82_9HYPO|nr:hypothetical protein IF1G_01002 [Cordyceps javanica]TQW12234.1 f-box-like domain-containing protein [Cordyceps javanica]